jgi:uncharacterized membrane protein
MVVVVILSVAGTLAVIGLVGFLLIYVAIRTLRSVLRDAISTEETHV